MWSIKVIWGHESTWVENLSICNLFESTSTGSKEIFNTWSCNKHWKQTRSRIFPTCLPTYTLLLWQIRKQSMDAGLTQSIKKDIDSFWLIEKGWQNNVIPDFTWQNGCKFWRILHWVRDWTEMLETSQFQHCDIDKEVSSDVVWQLFC